MPFEKRDVVAFSRRHVVRRVCALKPARDAPITRHAPTRTGRLAYAVHPELFLTFLCSLAYAGVAFVVLALLFDAVRSVSAPPVWSVDRDASTTSRAHAGATPLQPLEVLPVDPRHSGFAGLANEAEWKMTA